MIKSLVLVAVLIATALAAASKLQPYNVNEFDTSVGGLSSGGFFAVQMAVAYSSTIKGAGIFAGGPYDCAEGSISRATSTCMNALTPPNVNNFISTTNSRASKGQVDPTSNLANQKFFMFSGTADTTVRQPVMDALQTYLLNYMPASSILYVNNVKAAHTQPTDDPINKNACTTSASPYISNCNYDGAGDALQQIYGPLAPRNNGTLSGSLIQFDQSEFISSGYGMATSGWLYVPASCASGAACKLHVSFHGCLQNYATVGNAYVNNTGYNKWADTNNLIILYPQTTATHINPSNPNGCWDWWGYDNNPTTYDTNSGYQMVAVKKMIDRIASGASQSTINPPTSLTVSSTTSSSVSLKWIASTSTGVTGYNIYRNDALVNSSPVTTTSYTDSGLASGTTYSYYVRAVASGSISNPSSTVSATTSGSPPALTAPQNLQVKSTTSTSVTLTWNSVTGASGYNVYRNGTLANSQPTTSTSYTDSSLTPNTIYQYTVSAVNSAGVGPSSSPATATTGSGFACTSTTASNYAHVQADRAYVKLGYTYANGSNDSMGLYNILIYTTLAETAPNFYIVGSCPDENDRISANIV